MRTLSLATSAQSAAHVAYGAESPVMQPAELAVDVAVHQLSHVVSRAAGRSSLHSR
jgi:hypothetical protein